MSQDFDYTDPVAELIDGLIQRGIRRLETERPNVTIMDYLRLLQFASETESNTKSSEDEPEVIWYDDLPERDAA